LPFFVLLIRKLKMSPGVLTGMSIIVLTGMWLERFFLVAPSIWKGEEMPLGLIEFSITGGFLGAVGLTSVLFLKAFPLLPVSDPLFQEEMKKVLAELKEEQGAS
jgi:hypothetical protein